MASDRWSESQRRRAAGASSASDAGSTTPPAWARQLQAAQSRVTPFVVEVDKLGEVQAVAPAIQHYQPTDAQIAWLLARFITDVRSLSIDPVLVRKDWLEAYDFVTGHAATFLNGYANANDPFKAIGDRSVSVEVTSVVRASDTSFQVKWIEQVYRQGALVSTEH